MLFRLLKTVGSSIRTGWLILGIMLVAVLVTEAGLRLVFKNKNEPMMQAQAELRIADLRKHEIEPESETDSMRYKTEWLRDFGRVQRSSKFVSQPYVHWRHGQHQSRYLNIDQNGLRMTWNPLLQDSADDSSPAVRLFTFGGSTMWGWAARDDYTIASYLSKLLHERDYRAQVTNYGEPGYVSTQEVITLLRCIHRGEVPDIVLFYDGANEVFSSLANNEAGSLSGNRRLLQRFFPQEETNRGLLAGLLARGRAFLSRDFVGFDSLATELRRRIWPEQAGSLSDEVAWQTVHVYESNLAFIESLGRHYGFDSLFYWQPVIYSKQHLSSNEQAWVERSSHLYKEAFENVYQRVRQSESLNGHPSFHDISALFDDLEKPYYIDDHHLFEVGNRLVAEAMVDDVIELIEQRRAGTGAWENGE